MARGRGARLHRHAGAGARRAARRGQRCSRRSTAPGVRVLSVSWVGFATGVRGGPRDARRGVPRARHLVRRRRDPGARRARRSTCRASPSTSSPAAARSGCSRRGAPASLTSAGRSSRELVPQPVSWMGVRGSDDFSRLLDYDLTWRDDARRFEQITLPFQDFAGMARAWLSFTSSGRRPSRRTSRRARRAARLGGARATSRSSRRASGTPASRRSGPPMPRAASALLDAGEVTHSVREGTIRLAPHCYTTADEIGWRWKRWEGRGSRLPRVRRPARRFTASPRAVASRAP